MSQYGLKVAVKLGRIFNLYTENLLLVKSSDRGQPAQTEQADNGHYFLRFP